MRRLVVAVTTLASFASLGHAGPSSSAVGAATAPTPPRILYSSDWTGRTEIFALDPAHRKPLGQVTVGGRACGGGVLACGFAHPMPSPDGKRIAYVGVQRFGSEWSLWIARANGTAARKVAEGIQLGADRVATEIVAWSPDSSRLAYVQKGLHVVRDDGTQDRIVDPSAAGTPVWSRDGRRVAAVAGIPSPNGRWRATTVYRWPDPTIVAVDVTDGQRTYRFAASTVPAWSPDSRLIAFTAADGIRVGDLRTGRSRRLTRDRGFHLAWSPEGRSLAYIRGSVDRLGHVRSGALRTVTLSGRVTTLVVPDRAHGGRMVSLAWARPPASLRYRTPEPTPTKRVSADGVLAEWPIERIAADGDRVAYVACGRVFVWTRASGALVELEPGLPVSPSGRRCSSHVDYVAFWIYSLAVAGDRVVWGERSGNAGQQIWLGGAVLAPQPRRFSLGRAFGANGAPWSPGLGHAVGSGSLLVFGSGRETSVSDPAYRIVTTEQTVHRIGPDGCPCASVATSPGPLISADVDDDRIVVYGDNETLLLDRNGMARLSIPFSPRAAQLADRDLVLLDRGELRHYDADSGAHEHTWPLPDVASGAPSGWPRNHGLPRLVLQDAARGLVAYVLDGDVHVLRLADGADTVVAQGTAAGFMDSGLVYAEGTRLHYVPFGRLPQ
jgi:Tol biopolymer transport system component